jgi:hypothetical protein
MEWQLRSYRIEQGRLDEFVRSWQDLVLPLRQQMGFIVAGAWTVPEENRFIWLVGYDGPEGFKAKNDEYYASPERAKFDPDPAKLVTKGEHVMVTPVEME